MTRGRALAAALGVLLAVTGLPAARGGPAGDELRVDGVYASVTMSSVTLGNDEVERTWDRGAFQTASLVDEREGGRTWGEHVDDFELALSAGRLPSHSFSVTAVSLAPVDHGIRVTMSLAGPGSALTVQRVVDAYDGVAGFRTQTTVTSAVPLALTGARLETLGAGGGVAPSVSSFRAGADWRTGGNWPGAPVAVGDPRAGTWRDTRTAPAGQALEGAGQYVSVADPSGRIAFVELERNDLPSSRAAYDGAAASASVDLTRDVISLGPLEENAHAENPTAVPAGRARLLQPGTPFALAPTFVGFGTNADDEAWQFHDYLVGHRQRPFDQDVTFNSNGTDTNRISTGAKDDMDFATVQQVAPVARRLGVQTFILDDGWQGQSGDWVPDPARFPDDHFAAVRQTIAPMRLGLWMSPTFFNPASTAFKRHPDWVCQPIGTPLVADNVAQPGSGSNEAGLGPWGPNALPYVEGRIRNAIDNWGVSYFKFDFLVWLDCAGQGDMYDFHDRFVAMLDKLEADYPKVTFEIDETNDYRLFPFESVSRGPSWFQNGAVSVAQLLHNIWDLSPWVPASTLGQHFLGNLRQFDSASVETAMAAALLSHPTFFTDARDLPEWVVQGASEWLAFRRAHLAELTGVVFPLLDDPLHGGWTALQSWDASVPGGRGAMLAFRQGAATDTATVALRGVPADRTYDLVAAPSSEVVGTVTSAQLASGLDVTIPAPQGALVLLVEPHSA
ncbi:MAG TPA: alpha-galactosidase [Acidimicrobiales bacterium]|nr:alpha-galactosidase [Acidimicrobiales bacterium]